MKAIINRTIPTIIAFAIPATIAIVATLSLN